MEEVRNIPINASHVYASDITAKGEEPNEDDLPEHVVNFAIDGKIDYMDPNWLARMTKHVLHAAKTYTKCYDFTYQTAKNLNHSMTFGDHKEFYNSLKHILAFSFREKANYFMNECDYRRPGICYKCDDMPEKWFKNKYDNYIHSYKNHEIEQKLAEFE